MHPSIVAIGFETLDDYFGLKGRHSNEKGIFDLTVGSKDLLPTATAVRLSVSQSRTSQEPFVAFGRVPIADSQRMNERSLERCDWD